MLIPISPIHQSIGVGSIQVDTISKFGEIVSAIKSKIINKTQNEGEDIAAICKAVNIENIDIKFYFDNTQYVYFAKHVKEPYHVDNISFLEGFTVDEYLNYWNSNLDYIYENTIKSFRTSLNVGREKYKGISVKCTQIEDVFNLEEYYKLLKTIQYDKLWITICEPIAYNLKGLLSHVPSGIEVRIFYDGPHKFKNAYINKLLEEVGTSRKNILKQLSVQWKGNVPNASKNPSLIVFTTNGNGADLTTLRTL